MQTSEWIQAYRISAAPTLPEILEYDKPCGRTAREIAIRTVVLQGVVAVAAQVDSALIVDWFHQQGIWGYVTPEERVFLANEHSTEQERRRFFWHQEAEWALLWAIGKVEYLGLPNCRCDSARLVDNIIPALGADLEPFFTSAELLPPGVLLAEDDRTYNMWCYAQQARRESLLPEDLNLSVLYERRYAFEWLDGISAWDEVTCDA